MKLKDEKLADFIGTRRSDSMMAQQWNLPFCDGYYPSLTTMKFDEKWDWIVPVCQKAKEVNYSIANGPKLYLAIEHALLTLNIKKVNDACLKFIDQYNEQNKSIKQRLSKSAV